MNTYGQMASLMLSRKKRGKAESRYSCVIQISVEKKMVFKNPQTITKIQIHHIRNENESEHLVNNTVTLTETKVVEVTLRE